MQIETVNCHCAKESSKSKRFGDIDFGLPTMSKTNIFVAICSSCQTVENAVHSLQQAHFSVRKVSVIGKDYFRINEVPSDTSSERKHSLTDAMTFWGRIWRMLPGDAFLRLQEIGSIIIAGPISHLMRKAGTTPALFQTPSLLRACMVAAGISNENITRYEAALQSNRFLLIVQGSPDEVMAAAKILKSFGRSSKTKAKNAESSGLGQAGSHAAKAMDKTLDPIPSHHAHGEER